MKRIFSLFVIIAVFLQILLLFGCYDYKDIESELLVSGIAFDFTEDENGQRLYLVTAEVVTLAATSANKVSDSNLRLVDNSDKTLLAAILGIIPESSKKLSFSHCKTLIVSQEVAEDGIAPILDLVFRDKEIRFSMNLIVARSCNAYDLLTAEPAVGAIRAYEMVETIKVSAERLGSSPETYIYQIINGLHSNANATKVPAFSIKETVEEKETFYLDSTAIFDGDKLVGFISLERGIFCMIANGHFTSGLLTCYIPLSDSPFSVSVVGSHTKTFVELIDGAAEVTLKIESNLSFTEIPNDIVIKKDLYVERLISEIEKFIEDSVYLVVKDTIDRYGCDIFGFIDKAEKKNGGQQLNLSNEDFLRTLKLKVESTVHIQDISLSGVEIYFGGRND